MRLSWSISAVLAASSLFFGCATAQSQRHEGPMGTLVGAVALPDGASADTVCPNLSVAVLDASGTPMGDSSIHVSRGRCLYTVNYVKADEPLTLSVQGSAPRACNSGKLQPASQPQSVKLQDMETRTLDFALHCA